MYRQTHDKKTLKRINQLLEDIERNGYNGIGKPEPLKGNCSGYWIRRIDDTHRIVRRLSGELIEVLHAEVIINSSVDIRCPLLFGTEIAM